MFNVGDHIGSLEFPAPSTADQASSPNAFTTVPEMSPDEQPASVTPPVVKDSGIRMDGGVPMDAGGNRIIRKYKGTTRPPYITTELWRTFNPSDKKRAIKEYLGEGANPGGASSGSGGPAPASAAPVKI